MKTKLYRYIFFLFFLISSNFCLSQKIEIKPYVTGINQPIDLKHCGDDRLFVADRAGRIRIISADTLNTIPFLAITAKISSASGEEGLLGFAFSPNYKTDRKFYVDYTSNIGSQLTTVIEEYKVSVADSNVADPASSLTILTQPQPFSNHNGGNMMFGEDGYLYINLGDGGSGGDPAGNGQNIDTLLGKMLRLDVSNSSVATPYTIPPTNPFSASAPPVKKEIWAYGLRNPWRSSFDRITHDLWIADVGENKVEEVDFQAAGLAGGRNYGWNIVEGDSCYNPSSGCNKSGITMPVYEYFHNGLSESITGGYVYRSAQSKSLFGMYIFADYVQKFIEGFTLNGAGTGGTIIHLITAAQSTGNPVSFGEDRYGDLYILFGGINTVYRFQDSSYLRRPKAFFTPILQGDGSYLLQGLQGRNLTYQWLKDAAIIPGAISPDYIVNTAGTYNLQVTNTLSFSDISTAFSFSALPLDLKNFNAIRKASGIAEIQWQTVGEENIKGFAIQRKMNNQTTFTNIAFIEGKGINGNSNAEFQYSFIDTEASANTIFYRLQIRNRDGSYSYSAIRIINGNGTKQYLIYPNPAHGEVTILLDKVTHPTQLIIYDYAGRKVKQQQLTQQITNIRLDGFKGIYLFLLQNGGVNVGREKVVIK
jgi:Glucose / Sorbosone dehydrogenase/Secretion system C-terminal sorting domain